ncbi:hypothetical protein VPH35_004899 [Triticum aestivum]
MRGIQRMSTETQILQFIKLWELMQTIQLSTSHDSIVWKRSNNGNYTAKSAYEAQFIGRIPQQQLEVVWKANTRGKVKFYIWLLLQNRNWTTDRLARGEWPHNPICPLCDQAPETALHLLLRCPYAKELWFSARSIHQRMVDIALTATSINMWWRKLNSVGPKEIKRTQVRFAMYMAWNLWKERNRRVFQATSTQPPVLLQMLKMMSASWRRPFRNNPM